MTGPFSAPITIVKGSSDVLRDSITLNISDTT